MLYSQQTSDVDTFTITKLEPVPENNLVKLHLTDDVDWRLRDNIRITPPVQIRRYNSYYNRQEKVFYLYADFQYNQRYMISISDSYKSANNKRYEQTEYNFVFPDIYPDIIFYGNEKIIELKSRQLMHTELINVSRIYYESINISPFMLPISDYLINKYKDEDIDFVMLNNYFKKIYNELNNIISSDNIFSVLNYSADYSKEMFWSDREKNVRHQFSIPLSFRKNNNKGALKLVKLSSDDVSTGSEIFRISDIGITYKISSDNILIWTTELYTGETIEDVSLFLICKNNIIYEAGKTDESGILIISEKPYNTLSLSDVLYNNNISTNGSAIIDKSKILFDDRILNIEDLVYIIAVSESDINFVKLTSPVYKNNLPVSNMNQVWKAEKKSTNIRGHIFTERGIYKPGDTVYFKATLREWSEDNKIKTPHTVDKVLIKIHNSKNEQVYNRIHKLSEYGTVYDEFELKKYYPLGQYRVTLATEDGKENFAIRSFEYQHFVAPRHYAEITFQKESIIDNDYIGLKMKRDILICTVAGKYFAGGPVKHGRVRWSVYFDETKYFHNDFETYNFGYPSDDNELLETGETILDENGNAVFVLPLDKSVKSGMKSLKIYGTVVDFDGSVSTVSRNFSVKPKYLVGIREHRTEINPREEQHLEIIVSKPSLNNKKHETGTNKLNESLDDNKHKSDQNKLNESLDDIKHKSNQHNLNKTENNKFESYYEQNHKSSNFDSDYHKSNMLDRKLLVEEGELEVSVIRQGWTYNRKRNNQGFLFWEYQRVWRREFSAVIPIRDGRARFNFEFVQAGEYIISFTYKDEDNNEYISGTKFIVRGDEYFSEHPDLKKPWERIIIQSEKNNYLPGDDIKLNIFSREDFSSCLLTIERGNIIDYKIIEHKGRHSTITIPALEEYVPNVYISVTGITRRRNFPVYNAQLDNEPPVFSFGYINIEILDQSKELNIFINEDVKNLSKVPGEEVFLNIKTADEDGNGLMSELALAVIDESVLSLSGFTTPDLSNLIRFNLPLSVYSNDLRNELLKQTPYWMLSTKPLTGGDGLDSKIKELPDIRKDFRPVAFWHPAIETDENGNAEVSFRLPDSITRYRIYVVAVDKEFRVNSHHRFMTATKNFYIEPGIPEFFNKGDEFLFYVSAYNRTSEEGVVSLDIDTNENIKLSVKDNNLKISPYNSILIPVKGKAVSTGKSIISIYSNFNGLSDNIELEIPVYSGYIHNKKTLFGTFEKETKISYDITEEFTDFTIDDITNDYNIKLLVGNNPFIQLSSGLKYLLEYPYGCAEQVSSGIIPLAGLRLLIKENLIPEFSIDETDKFLNNGIEKLLQMQTNDGGFSYWQGQTNSNHWVSLYAISALSFARMSGIEVNEIMFDNAISYLQRKVLDAGIKENNFKVIGAYLLAYNGKLTRGIFQTLRRNLRNLTDFEKFIMQWTAITAGIISIDRIDESIINSINNPDFFKSQNYFFDNQRNTALTLLAMSDFHHSHSLTGKLADRLLSRLSAEGNWQNTANTGWSLIALGNYFKDLKFAEEKFNCIVEINNDKTEISIDTVGFTLLSIDPQLFFENGSINLKTDYNHSIIYRLEIQYPETNYLETGYENGFKISKTIENTRKSSDIKTGDIVKVNIKITSENNYRFVVLDDPLPAGLVAVNSAIKTEEPVAKMFQNDYNKDEYYYSYWDASGFFRFVPNFFEIRHNRVLVFKDNVWQNEYRYSYYARAVCAGEFIIPATKIQLMYEPEIMSLTPRETLRIY